jgi:hypothetical protein
VNESEGTATVIIPTAESLLTRALAASTIVLLIVIPTFQQLFSHHAPPNSGQVSFLIVLVVIAGVPLISVIVYALVGRKRKKTTVKASPEGLTIERRTVWRTRTKRVSAADILVACRSEFVSMTGFSSEHRCISI